VQAINRSNKQNFFSNPHDENALYQLGTKRSRLEMEEDELVDGLPLKTMKRTGNKPGITQEQADE